MREPSFSGCSTRSVHEGEARFKAARSLTNPIFQTSTFVFESLEEYRAFKAGERQNFEYGRYGNPTQQVAEEKLAALDGGEAALLFPSGMSAVTSALLALLQGGQHLIAIEDCYRMTTKFCQFFGRFGVETSLVQPGDFEGLSAAVRPGTRVILVESPSNVHLRVSDFERLAAFAREHRLRLLVDSTFGSPVNQRPLESGVDLVIHSATKYLGGHNDLLAGSVCGAEPLIEMIREFRNISGAIPSPHTCYLLIRGLKTLALRMRHQNESGARIARYLEEHPKVRQVYYPGLESHPDHEIARRQMEGFGGVVSFELDGDMEQVERFVQALRIPRIGPSFGGPEALVTYPAVVSFYDMEREERLALGVTDQLVRYAAGMEETEDLLEDLEQALARV